MFREFFFRNKLSDDLREIVVQKEKGLMKFDFHIKYDTFGNNNSFLSMRESSIHGLEKKIIKLHEDLQFDFRERLKELQNQY